MAHDGLTAPALEWLGPAREWMVGRMERGSREIYFTDPLTEFASSFA
jgi:hypothetical protein